VHIVHKSPNHSTIHKVSSKIMSTNCVNERVVACESLWIIDERLVYDDFSPSRKVRGKCRQPRRYSSKFEDEEEERDRWRGLRKEFEDIPDFLNPEGNSAEADVAQDCQEQEQGHKVWYGTEPTHAREIPVIGGDGGIDHGFGGRIRGLGVLRTRLSSIAGRRRGSFFVRGSAKSK
jgi:hypothetical protein